MIGLNIKEQCDQLLRDIANLKTRLEAVHEEEDRKRITEEIEAKQQIYEDLQCGAVDPKRTNITES